MVTKFKNKTDSITGILIHVNSGSHLCQLFHNEQDLVDVLVPYFNAGLKDNELCLWITSEPMETYQATKVLNKHIEGLDKYIKKGQMEILSQKEWYTRAGKFSAHKVLLSWLQKERIALRKGFNGLRIATQTFELQPWQWHNLISYESMADSVIRRHKIIAICAYPVDLYTATEIVDIVCNHRFILLKRDTKWELIDNTGHKWLNELKFTGSSYAEIGRKLGLSRERVRQIIMGRGINDIKTQSSDQMMTVSKASKLLGVHANTLRRWSDQGELPYYRVGARRDRKYKRDELIAFRRKDTSRLHKTISGLMQ
jgi:excisionase family DNA binding protein